MAAGGEPDALHSVAADILRVGGLKDFVQVAGLDKKLVDQPAETTNAIELGANAFASMLMQKGIAGLDSKSMDTTRQVLQLFYRKELAELTESTAPIYDPKHLLQAAAGMALLIAAAPDDLVQALLRTGGAPDIGDSDDLTDASPDNVATRTISAMLPELNAMLCQLDAGPDEQPQCLPGSPNRTRPPK